MEHVTVHGVDVAAIGLGTYWLRGDECTDVVETALEMGYRHIDMAEFYTADLRRSPIQLFVTQTYVYRHAGYPV